MTSNASSYSSCLTLICLPSHQVLFLSPESSAHIDLQGRGHCKRSAMIFFKLRMAAHSVAQQMGVLVNVQSCSSSHSIMI